MSLRTFIVLLGLFTTYIAGQSPWLIDDFNDFSSVRVTGSTSTAFSTISGSSGVIGGDRTLTGRHLEGPLSVSCHSLPSISSFTFSADVQTRGNCSLDYDGDFDPPLDVISTGCSCYLVRIIEADNNARFSITARTESGYQTSSLVTSSNIEEPTNMCLPLGGGLTSQVIQAHRAVTGMEVSFEGEEANVDILTDFLCCAAPVACCYTISAVGRTGPPYVTGDSVEVNMNCYNYHKLDGYPVDTRVHFPFSSSIGSVQPGNCDRGFTTSVEGNAFVGTGTLQDGEALSCTFTINLTGAGTESDILFDIGAYPNDPSFVSSGGVCPIGGIANLVMSADFCVSPSGASLTVAAANSTEPTAAAPTAAPPTVGPPPPTAAPPTSPPPTAPPPTPTEPPKMCKVCDHYDDDDGYYYDYDDHYDDYDDYQDDYDDHYDDHYDYDYDYDYYHSRPRPRPRPRPRYHYDDDYYYDYDDHYDDRYDDHYDDRYDDQDDDQSDCDDDYTHDHDHPDYDYYYRRPRPRRPYPRYRPRPTYDRYSDDYRDRFDFNDYDHSEGSSYHKRRRTSYYDDYRSGQEEYDHSDYDYDSSFDYKRRRSSRPDDYRQSDYDHEYERSFDGDRYEDDRRAHDRYEDDDYHARRDSYRDDDYTDDHHYDRSHSNLRGDDVAQDDYNYDFNDYDSSRRSTASLSKKHGPSRERDSHNRYDYDSEFDYEYKDDHYRRTNRGVEETRHNDEGVTDLDRKYDTLASDVDNESKEDHTTSQRRSHRHSH